jgi:hypothetical protein
VNNTHTHWSVYVLNYKDFFEEVKKFNDLLVLAIDGSIYQVLFFLAFKRFFVANEKVK